MIPVLAVLLTLILVGMPIAIALGLTAAAFVAGSDVPFNVFPVIMIGSLENFVLLALPLFMIAGEVANRAGIAEQLVELVSSLFGWMRGGLAQCATAGGMVFAEISGSSVADVASLATILVPVMEKRGYPKAFAAAVTSASASIAIIIPPSIPLVLYGVVAEQSVAKMFVAGLAPGLFLAVSLMIFNYGFALRYGWKPEARFEIQRVLRAFKNGFWGLALPVVILGGILGGIFTPTEAGAMAVATAFLIGFFITRRVVISDIPAIVLAAAKRSGAVLLLISTSSVFGWYLTNAGIPRGIAHWILGLSHDRHVVMFGLNMVLLLLGTFLHGAAAIMLIVPLALPMVKSIGYNPIHFGIILALNMAIGQQIPPTAAVLMTASTISGARIKDIMFYNKWYILCMFIVLQLVTYVPAISMWLPTHLLSR
jgi:tripartite ATP-independent transporter DctM subunit